MAANDGNVTMNAIPKVILHLKKAEKVF